MSNPKIRARLCNSRVSIVPERNSHVSTQHCSRGRKRADWDGEKAGRGVVLLHILKWAKTSFCLLMQIEHKTKRDYGRPLPPHVVGLITFYTLCCCWRQLVDFPKQRLRLGQLFIVHLLVVFLRGRKKSKLRWREEFLSHILKQKRREGKLFLVKLFSSKARIKLAAEGEGQNYFLWRAMGSR